MIGSHELARRLLALPDLPIRQSDGSFIADFRIADRWTPAEAEKVARLEDEGSYLKRERMELASQALHTVSEGEWQRTQTTTKRP